jgi:hypothetical protein
VNSGSPKRRDGMDLLKCSAQCQTHTMELERPPTNFEWLWAKVGQRRIATHYAVGMLTRLEDLPADEWSILGQRTWRTGKLGHRSDEGDRAAEMGTVTAVRSFQNSSHTRWFMTKVVPMATTDDAQLVLERASQSGMKNPRAKVALLRELRTQAPVVLGVSASWALEHHVFNPERGEHVVQLMGATVGKVVLTLQASGWTDWSWSEVSAVAETAVRRINAAQEGAS